MAGLGQGAVWSWGLGVHLGLDLNTGGAGDDPEPFGGKCGIFALRFEPAVEPQKMLKPGVSPNLTLNALGAVREEDLVVDGGIAELGMGGPSGQERSFNLNARKERVGIEPIEAWWQCGCTEGGLAGLVDELSGERHIVGAQEDPKHA